MWRYCLIMLSCWFVPVSFSLAQVPNPGDIGAIIPQQNLIIEQETQRRNAFERSIRQMDPPQEEKHREDEDDAQQQEGACIAIDRIELVGATLLDAGGQEALFGDMVPSCMHVGTMDDVIARISNWYLDAGYVTTRAYLTPQDLASGILTITILEGTVGSLTLHEEGVEQSASKAAIIPVRSQAYLNLRDIEQGIDQINRLASHNATVKLHPADQPGVSNVAVDSSKRSPIYASTSIDNSGQKTTGVGQAALDITAEDVLGMLEQIRISTKNDLAPDDKTSRSFSGFVSIPYGYWTLSWTSTLFDYASVLTGLNQSFSSTGNTRTHTAEIQRLIHRDHDSKTSLSASIGVKDTRNYVADVFIPVSSRRLSVGTLRVQHSGRAGGSILSLSGTYQQGLRLWGAMEDAPDQSDRSPKAQFSKWTGHVGLTIPQLFAMERISLDSQLHLQYSPDTLYPTENLALGGLYTIRGFRDQSLSGDSGAHLRSQLTVQALQEEGLSWQHYLALDAGWIKSTNTSTQRGGLAGATLGTLLNVDLITAQFAWEQPLYSPSSMNHDDPIIYARLGLRVPF